MEHIVSAQEHGMLLRRLLRGTMGVSYSAMKSAKWDQRILVNGAPCPVDRRLETGDIVTFLPKEAVPVYQLTPYSIPLNIVYRDDSLIIIDKPAPLASQSSLGHPDDSLENALFAWLGCPEDFIYRPVNRLDKGTSGLMAIALDAHTQHRMQSLLHTDCFIRTYLAVTEGIPKEAQGTISAPIGKVDEASIRREVRPDGRPSVTHYQVLKTTMNRALVRLRLETGRTHQIRVHLSSIGCPVVGDFLYGAETDELPGRFALHSHAIRLQHPITKEWIEIESPLPEEIMALLR